MREGKREREGMRERERERVNERERGGGWGLELENERGTENGQT